MHNLQSPRSDDQGVEQLIQAKGKTAPRITPDQVERNIAEEHYFTAAEGAGFEPIDYCSVVPPRHKHALDLLTFCVLVLDNGFAVTGESVCASAENFDAEIGRKIARANAVQKIWPLMGYELRTMLSGTY